MAKLRRVYWDSCAWLGLINGEIDKLRELEIIYDAARNGECEIWTSTYSLMECNRYDVEKNKSKPLDPTNLAKIEVFFRQPFIKLVPVDLQVTRHAVQLIRETPGLTKKPDAVHLASALRWSVDALHTYDGSDLLHLSYKFADRQGRPLQICTPNEASDGPLFAKVGK